MRHIECALLDNAPVAEFSTLRCAAASQVFCLKEANSCRVVNDLYSRTTRIALNNERSPKNTFHPHVNWPLRQFIPAVESPNSIHGETVSRVAHPEHTARLATCLKVALLCPPTIFTRRNYIKDQNKKDDLTLARQYPSVAAPQEI